jgi:hypothetical protein
VGAMSKSMAIFMDEHGEITTPDFAGLAALDHPGGHLWHVRDLIDSADPCAAEVPNSHGLVMWLDGFAHERRRSANMLAGFVLADAFDSPLPIICGPVMFTGGSIAEPCPMGPREVVRAMNALGLRLYPNAPLWLLRKTLSSRLTSIRRRAQR